MTLKAYRQKRNFKVTSEPPGRPGKRRASSLSFVIQKHAASHLHYDFRLELNGVLLSWAVPKGPSLDPNDKRLAMHVEDHPLEYGTFEGVIPAKQYGAGTVLLWDRGTWIHKEDPQAGYKKGKLKFELRGEKLRGGWVLVKSHGGEYGGGKSWLLIKEDDEFARRGPQALIGEEKPMSVASGRTMAEIASDPERVWHSNKSVAENVKHGSVRKRSLRLDLARVGGAVKASLPAFVEPQLATLVDSAPDGDAWVHEMKYDGYRMLCRKDGEKVRIFTRNRNDWTAKFPTLAASIARLPLKSAWIDGEIVVPDAEGRTSFQALQNALSNEADGKLQYFAFDLLYVDGYDIRKSRLLERKRLLEQIFRSASGILHYSEHFEVPGSEFLAHACKLKLEGAVSKRADSPYLSGRGRSWLKIKCGRRQEMVIGGFTDPEGSRSGFGALLLGIYEADGRFRYSGKVGTGFNDATLQSLRAKLERLASDKTPFYNPPTGAEARRSHWVKPQLVAEISFTEWTTDGTLRHPSFLGLRTDKKAKEVVREVPAVLKGPQNPAAGMPLDNPNSTKPAATLQSGTKRRTVRSGRDDDTIAGVTLTNPTKFLYADARITKLDLARYYESIGDWILPHLRQRPLTLVRCPNGWDKQCFYQKHADASVDAAIDRVAIEDSSGSSRYMMANSISALVALLQMGVLELHPWGSASPKLAFPDRMVFDFDPDDELAWKDVVQAAQIMKTLLEEIGLQGFVKTTGGKGLHIVIPIDPTQRWNVIKGFTKTIAELLTRTFPDRFTAKMSKAARHGKIFVDYLRNDEGSTAIAAYSTRARAGAPVATPVAWNELSKDIRFDYFNVRNVPARLKRLKADPWADFFSLRQALTKPMMKKIGYVEA